MSGPDGNVSNKDLALAMINMQTTVDTLQECVLEHGKILRLIKELVSINHETIKTVSNDSKDLAEKIQELDETMSLHF